MQIKALLKGFLAGLVAFGGALLAIFLGAGSKDRYEVQAEVEDEIERKAEAAREAERRRIQGMDPAAIVASLPAESRERIDAAKDAAIRRALDRAASRTDGSGVRSDNPGSRG